MGSTNSWTVEAGDGLRVLDIGDEHGAVRTLKVAVIGGSVDVVAHEDDSDGTARVEVADVVGMPVRIGWDGSTLKVTQHKDDDRSVLDMIRKTVEGLGRSSVRLSIAVPRGCGVTVSTVSASVLVAGIASQTRVKTNTVSGSTTVQDLHADVDVNTVSGSVTGSDLAGNVKANTVSGAVTLQRSRVPEARLNTVSGDLTLDLLDPQTDVKVSSVSGETTIRAPHSGYDVAATTMSAVVVIDGKRFSRTSGGMKGGETGRLREGDERLKVKAASVSGNVVVLRRDLAAGSEDGGENASGAAAFREGDAGMPGASGSGSAGSGASGAGGSRSGGSSRYERRAGATDGPQDAPVPPSRPQPPAAPTPPAHPDEPQQPGPMSAPPAPDAPRHDWGAGPQDLP